MKPKIAKRGTAGGRLLPAEKEHGDRALVEALVNSRIYRDYESAFSNLTGLPIALQTVETWQLPYHNKHNENPLCALMTQQNSSCAACLQVQEEVCHGATAEPHTVTCALGLTDSAIPVRMNNHLIGFLQVGQVFRKKPTQAQFEKVVKLAQKWEIKADRATLKQAFFSGKVVTPSQLGSAIKLLSIFAQQLSTLSNQVFIQSENTKSPGIVKAQAYIESHQQEKLTLRQVATAAGMSPFYFCKEFGKEVGITFTDYVARVRIEKSKSLLLNPNLRISEIAFEVGFQSLTHFNRVFKKLMNESPTDYRDKLTSV